jgi:hypothetical protein
LALQTRWNDPPLGSDEELSGARDRSTDRAGIVPELAGDPLSLVPRLETRQVAGGDPRAFAREPGATDDRAPQA